MPGILPVGRARFEPSGAEVPADAVCIEAFQLCEYGRAPAEAELKSLFAVE